MKSQYKVDNDSFERVEEFKYLGTNQNSIQEETKIRLESRECLLSFGAESLNFLFSIQKFKIYGIIILPVVLNGCETWSLTLREERKFRVFENRLLGEYLGLRGTR